MNLAVALVLLSAIAASQWQQPEPVSDLGLRLALIGLITALVPALALWQTRWLNRRHLDSESDQRDRQRAIARLSASHTAVWLAASLAIILALRWHEVVRVNWQWADWLAVDDLIILSPILGSLLASWAIFFDLTSPGTNTESSNAGVKRRTLSAWPRLAHVELRARIQLLLLVPILLITLVLLDIDFSDWRFNDSTSVIVTLTVLAVVGWLLPAWLAWTWSTEPLDAPTLDYLLPASGAHQLRPHQIRLWKTRRRVTNACLLGWTTRSCRVLLSDGLLARFPVDETRAIVRHELAHLRRGHAWCRIAVLWAPLVGLACASQIAFGSPLIAEHLSQRLDWTPATTLALLTAFYGLLTWPILAFVCRRQEFEADAIAAGLPAAEGIQGAGKQGLDHAQNAMFKALLRLEAVQGTARSGWLHPSLAERRQRLHQQGSLPDRSCPTWRATWGLVGFSLLGWVAASYVALTWLGRGLV